MSPQLGSFSEMTEMTRTISNLEQYSEKPQQMALILNNHSMKHGARPQTDELKMLNFNLTDFKAAFNQCTFNILREITQMTTFSSF